MSISDNWITVCSVGDLVTNSGVCALIDDKQIAIFKLKSANDESVLAVSNWDPIGKANVLYRGLIGTVENRTVIASPLYKQRYCLASGACLDDEKYALEVFTTRIVDQQVQLNLVS